MAPTARKDYATLTDEQRAWITASLLSESSGDLRRFSWPTTPASGPGRHEESSH